jgi:hypothetical protein
MIPYREPNPVGRTNSTKEGDPMAVLVEGISVVIRCGAIVGRFPGSEAGFRGLVPNDALCIDGELACVAFKRPDEARQFVEKLAKYGIRYSGGTGALDLVVVHQHRGFATRCAWAQFGRINWEDDPKKIVAVCCATNSQVQWVYTPDNWTYENSLSTRFDFVPEEQLPEVVQFERQEDGAEVLRDLESGKDLSDGRNS